VSALQTTHYNLQPLPVKKFHLQKTKLKPFHFFYIGFFALYFFILYFFLYHANGLQPFQINVHFFSNVVGSISKRFLSETAPYALIFYLLYYTKAVWKRIFLIALFEILFLINMMGIGFYYIVRSNFQFYVLEGFNIHIFLSYFTPFLTFITVLTLALMALLAVALFKIRNRDKNVWLLKKRLFTVFLFLLAVGSPFIPVRYSALASLMHPDTLEKRFHRSIELEQSPLTTLLKEFHFKYSLHTQAYKELTDEEKEYLEKNHLDTQLTQPFPNPPKKIILVVVESLNQTFLSYYNPEIAGTTPYLDELFETYPHIDEFYPSGPFTLQGVSSLACGHTNARLMRQDNDFMCAPELMADAGYKTELIRGASKYYVGENLHFKKFGYDTLFAREEFEEKFPDFKEARPDLYNAWGYTDNFIFDEAVERLKESPPDEKLFLTLLTVDTHVPGGRCFERGAADSETPVQFSVRCFDQVFKAFMGDLEKNDLLDEDTVILLTADQLYPAYKTVPGSRFQTSFVLEPARIPLLMISANDYSFQARQGSQIDVASTLLDLANLEIPDYYMGKSLLSNPYTIPTGQDRLDGYMISDGEFSSLSLYAKPYLLSEEGPKTFNIYPSPDATPEEVEALIDKKVKEYKQEQNKNETLFKWYYNKYFNLNGD